MYEKLLKVQEEIGVILKDKDNPYFKSKYADINTILSQVKPILNKHGLILTQGLDHIKGSVFDNTPTEPTLALKTSIIYAASGQEVVSNTCPIPENLDPQKQGSAITYFRRYALQSLLALEAEDDDGNVAAGKVVVAGTRKKVEPVEPTEPPKFSI